MVTLPLNVKICWLNPVKDHHRKEKQRPQTFPLAFRKLCTNWTKTIWLGSFIQNFRNSKAQPRIHSKFNLIHCLQSKHNPPLFNMGSIYRSDDICWLIKSFWSDQLCQISLIWLFSLSCSVQYFIRGVFLIMAWRFFLFLFLYFLAEIVFVLFVSSRVTLFGLDSLINTWNKNEWMSDWMNEWKEADFTGCKCGYKWIILWICEDLNNYTWLMILVWKLW